MKKVLLTLTIHADYRDNSYYDLEKEKFLKELSLEDIEEKIALWILMFEHPNIKLDLVHMDRPTEFAGDDDNQGELHGD